MRVAAVQLEPALVDVAENLRRCELLADRAGRAGADWIVLPEFFTTGMAFLDELAEAALPEDGAATELMLALARRHGATVSGSFICRDRDGHNRNAALLVTPEGVRGRHDKDLPTMWENCFYVGGSDDGVLTHGDLAVGVALCWELMRTQTAERLRGRVDVVVAGSAWWSIPEWPPKPVTRRLEAANARTAAKVAPALARLVGAPVAHAAHCGEVRCRLPWAPGVPYRGHYQGGAVICNARGEVLARRGRQEGEGFAIADLTPGRTAAADPLPGGFWLHSRGAVAAALWAYQGLHGRRWYRRHAVGLPPLELELERDSAAVPAG